MTFGHQPRDSRPQNCRNRLRDEGKAYPRTGCDVCLSCLHGCPYERRPEPPTSGSGVQPPKPMVQNISINVDASGIAETTQALKLLTEAADRAGLALANLGNQPHGGVEIKIVGSLVHVEIKPPTA